MIGIISDTHDNVMCIKKAVEIFKKNKVEFVIHAGDIVAPASVRYFDGLKMKFVFGNCDGDRARIEDKVKLIGGEHYGRSMVIKHQGKSIGVVHGDNDMATENMLVQGHDYLIHGHTHVCEDKKSRNTRVLCPGGFYLGDDPGQSKIILLDVEKDKATFIEVK